MPTLAPVNLRDWGHTAAQRGWGQGWPGCSGTNGQLVIVTFKRSGVRVSVHRRIARLVQILGDETERRGHLAKLGQTGAFNCRPIGGTRTPSNHSWAIAIDWNWQDNPFSRNPRHTNPDWMYELWARFGFANGAMYSGAKDWMHIEFMGSPQQADWLTSLAEFEILGNPQPPVPIIPPAPGPGVIVPILWIQEAEMALPVLYEGDGVKGTRRGVTHWYVLRLQAMLNVCGLKAVVPLDGVFGRSTTVAVKELQAARRVTADGAVGPVTWGHVHGNPAPDFVTA